MNPWQAAAQALALSLGTLSGLTITYLPQGGTPLTNVACSVAETVFELHDAEGGFISKHESRDYLIAASALTTPPARGDLIQEGPRTFEVFAPEGEQHAPFEDRFQTIYRIHTRNVTPPPGNA